MTTFTNEQTKTLMAKADEILKNIAEGETVRDIMARMYVENLDEKTLQQGQVMADAILDAVKDFDVSYLEAQEDLDTYIKKFQKQADEGKTCVDRCNYWLRMAAAITAANAAMDNGSADREVILIQIQNLSVSEAAANEALEKELRDKAREALKGSGVLLTGLLAQAQDLAEMADSDDAAGLLIDLGNQEIEYRALVSMLAYTSVKTGALENIPVDMTAVQITNLICAQVEELRILDSVGKGNLPMEIAECLLVALGVVVLLNVLFFAINVAALLIAELFGAFLAIPAMLMVGYGLLKLFNKAVDEWEKDSKQIVKATSAVVKFVVKGIVAVADYVKDVVIPAVVDGARNLMSWLHSKFDQKEAAIEEEEIIAAKPYALPGAVLQA